MLLWILPLVMLPPYGLAGVHVVPLGLTWRTVRVADGWLMTPTNSSLGELVPGQLSKLDLENSEKFGVAKLADLSWKEILDTYSCTECGRCQTYCPTYDTGKPLTHKEMNRAIRQHAQEMAEKMPLPLAQLARRLNRIRPVNGSASSLPGTGEVKSMISVHRPAIGSDVYSESCR